MRRAPGRFGRSTHRLRLAAILSCLGASGCDETKSETSHPPTSRFEAVAAKTDTADPLKDFCDVRAEPGQGKAFHFPAVESGSAPDPQKFLWLNVWATWCKPCIDELPRIAAWQKQLAAQGKPIEVRFLSVDENVDAVSEFRAAHPGTPESLRIADSAALGPFITEIGLDSGAGLPVHIFVEKGSHVRCVRSGAVLDSHFATITSMLQ